MRLTFSLLCLVALIGTASPAQAQLRQDVHEDRAEVKLYDQSAPGFSLNQVFSPQHFRMGHSYEMSFGSFGGSSYSLGMYTNTMQWQFSQKLAARMDVGVAFTPFGGEQFGDTQNGRVFLRNAEIAYRPSENTVLHISVRQSPYGGYMSPYGYYSPYGYSPYYSGDVFNVSYGSDARRLFWNDRLR